MPDPVQRPDISSDLLTPIGTDNRDEVILVEFHRCLKNTNMSILHNMAKAVRTEPNLELIFTGLKDFVKMSKDVRFMVSSLYNRHWEFVRMLLKEHMNQIPEPMIRDYAEAYLHPLHLGYLHTTRLEVVVKMLSEKEFVKKIYVTAPEFTDEMKAYLVALFGAETVDTKIVCAANDPNDVLREDPSVTTAFLSNADDVLELVRENHDQLKGKYIVLLEGYGNLVPIDDQKLDSFRHVGDDVFKKLQEDRICVVAHMYPYFTPVDSAIPNSNERTDSTP